jgi:hypothetical protein
MTNFTQNFTSFTETMNFFTKEFEALNKQQSAFFEPIKQFNETAVASFEALAKLNHKLVGDYTKYSVNQAKTLTETSDMLDFSTKQYQNNKDFCEKIEKRRGEYSDVAKKYQESLRLSLKMPTFDAFGMIKPL